MSLIVPITVRSGTWETLREAVSGVRRTVFVEEQGIALDDEFDDTDPVCTHFAAFDDAGRPIGCARLLPDGHIGRVAVMKPQRGRGTGRLILKAVLAYARDHGFSRVVLNAQTQARGFYETLGFAAHDDTFLECGIPHVTMTLALSQCSRPQ